MTRHIVLDDGRKQFVIPIGKEIGLADIVRGLTLATLERIVARGVRPAAGVNSPEAVAVIEAELRRRQLAGIP